MSSDPGLEVHRPQRDSHLPAPCALWPVDLHLTHVDCSPADTLVHFQGQYLTVCELDYNILQVEIQNAQKTAVSVNLAGLYLVEDAFSGCWYRGRVQNRQNNLYDVFLVDYGSVLTVDASHLASASSEMFMLPPKIVCGFFANILPSGEHWDDVASAYFSSLVGTKVKGYIQAFLPHKVMILEAPEVNRDLLKQNSGRNMDRDTFLVLVEMLIQVPLKQKNRPPPDLLIEKQAGQEFSFEPSRLQDFESVLSFNRPKLSVGGKYRARITAAVKASLFYCQLTSMEEDLKEITNNLSLCCESETEDSPGKSVGNMGLLCAARGKDDKWHRGLVQCLPVNSHVQVLFTDYGFCESVNVKCIHQLPPYFLSFPFMAFPCILSCISDPDMDVQEEQLNLFKRALLGSVLDFQIDNFNVKDNLYVVTLICSADHEEVAEFEKNNHSTRQVPSSACAALSENSRIPPQDGCAVQRTNEFKRVELFENLGHLKRIKEKCVFEGIVEHVQNPWDFWLRTVEQNCKFEAMTQKMKKYFNALPLDTGTLKNPVPGVLCCALYEKDLLYYRAVVKKIIKHGAEVHFIDFGNTENVPHMHIKELPLEFTGEPAFALNCSLAHVIPVQDVWTVSVNDYFRTAVLNKVFLVYVVHKHKDKLVVELREGEASESINMQLAKAELAMFWTVTPASFFHQRQKIFQKFPATKVRYISRNLKQSSEPRKSKNVVAVENGGLCAKETMTQMGSEEKQALAKVNFFKQLTFGPGSEVSIQRCHINSPSDFWCQPKSHLGHFNRLMAEMQEYYEKHGRALQPNETGCVIKRVEDRRWYRGCIIGHEDDDDKVGVILVDLGIILKERPHKLRAVEPKHCELEGQAFRCSFYGLIEPLDKYASVWSAKASSLLKDFVEANSKNLSCFVQTVMSVKSIGLFHIVEVLAPHQSATSLLSEKGVAKKINCPNRLISSGELLSYVFSMFDIEIGSMEDVHVTHVCSQWEFYCQLERNGKMLGHLMEEVTRISSKLLCENVGSFHGKLCLAKYLEDGQWYRGLAFPIQSSLHFNVLFVDYGNMHVVEKKNVLPIPRSATRLLFVPMQALRCRLLSVPKGNVVMEADAFLQKAALNAPLQARFVGKDEDGTLVCDLFNGNLYLNKEVRDLLAVHSKLFVGSGPSLRWDKDINGAKQNVPLGKNRSQCQTDLAVKKWAFSSTESSMTPAVCQGDKARRVVSRTLASNGSSVGGKHQRKATCSPLKKQMANITLARPSCLPEMEIKAGFRVVAFVSHVTTATDFYIQMKKDEPAILEICDQLNSSRFRQNAKCITEPVNTGDLIAAMYEEDGSLYRAVVTNVNNDHLTVEFIDYGNVAMVEKRDTRMLSSTFLTRPRLSIRCSQEKVHGFGVDALFQALVTDRPLLMQFIRQYGSQWTVKIEVNNEDGPPVYLSKNNCSSDEVKEIVSSLTRNEVQTGDGHSTVQEEEVEDCCPNIQGLEPCNGAMRNNSVTLIKLGRSINVNRADVALSGEHQIIPMSEHHLTVQSAVRRPQVTNRAGNASSDLPKGEQANSAQQNVIPGQKEEGILNSLLENGGFAKRLNRNEETSALLVQLLEKNVLRSDGLSVMDRKEEPECLAKSHKNQWCRTMVQKVLPSQGPCSVLLLDHGTTVSLVCTDCIKGLRQVPVQAVCSLSDYSNTVNGKIFREILKTLTRQNIALFFVSYSEASQLWMTVLLQQFEHTKHAAEQRKSLLKGNGNYVQAFWVEDVPQLSVAPLKKQIGCPGLAVAVVAPYAFHVILEELLLARNMISAALEDISVDVFSLPEAHPNACCLVKCGMKNKWYRAEVVHEDKVSVEVTLIDYDCCFHVPCLRCQQLKQLPKKLGILKFTHQGVFRGVSPSHEAVVFFQEHVCENNLMIYFSQSVSEAQLEVDVSQGGHSVAMMLVDAGQSFYSHSFIGLRFQQQEIPAQDSLPFKPLGDQEDVREQAEEHTHGVHSDHLKSAEEDALVDEKCGDWERSRGLTEPGNGAFFQP